MRAFRPPRYLQIPPQNYMDLELLFVQHVCHAGDRKHSPSIASIRFLKTPAHKHMWPPQTHSRVGGTSHGVPLTDWLHQTQHCDHVQAFCGQLSPFVRRSCTDPHKSLCALGIRTNWESSPGFAPTTKKENIR